MTDQTREAVDRLRSLSWKPGAFDYPVDVLSSDLRTVLAALSETEERAERAEADNAAYRKISAAMMAEYERDEECCYQTINALIEDLATLSPAPTVAELWQPITDETLTPDGYFWGAIRVSYQGGPPEWHVHLLAGDDETDNIHPDYEQGWRFTDYEFFQPINPPPAPTAPRFEPVVLKGKIVIGHAPTVKGEGE